MGPAKISNTLQSSSPDATPEELEAAACLPQGPEQLESRATDSAPPPPPVKKLVDAHPSSGPPPLPPKSDAPASESKGALHRGLALSIGANVALGPVGVEASLGVVVDLSAPKISVFTGTGGGAALAPGGSGGVSGQVSYVNDTEKFWGSGTELGANLPAAGAALGYTPPTPAGPRELNSGTGALGPSAGADVHMYATETVEHGNLTLDDVRRFLERAAQTSLHRFGP